MKIKYIGETIELALTKGKVYDVLAIEKGPDLLGNREETDWLRIVTDIEEDYLFCLKEGKDYEIVRR